MAWRWRGLVILTTLAVLLVTAIDLTVPAITRGVIAGMENRLNQDAANKAVLSGVVLMALFLIRAVLNYVNFYYAHVFSWGLVCDVRCDLYNHYQSLSMGYYQDKQTGEMMSRVLSDTATFEDMMAHAIPELTSNIITFVGVLAVLFVINPLLAGLVCLPVPLIALFSSMLRKIRYFRKEAQEHNAELSAALQDNFSGMKEIQLFNKQEFEDLHVRAKSDKQKVSLLRALRIIAVLHPSVALVTNIGTVIVLICGPIFALKFNMPVSDVVAFLLYLGLFYTPVANLARILETIQTALAGADRVFEVLDTPPDIFDGDGAEDCGRLTGQITFDNVSFAYDEDTPVLDEISFSAKAGEMIALVGPTGVGKSTISSLIARFYEPTGGRILLDGIDTRILKLSSLRNQLSMVLQDVFLFNGTIAENISYGCDGCSEEDIVYAAKIACIDEYIGSLPQKYQTVIGERGVRLSGGQKQRISIARSILRDSPILVLDEATSAADTETEKHIQEAIDRIAGTRTLVVIAHRLSTVKKADRIIVLQDGKIAEQGKHEELMALEGVYANLCQVQSVK